ncbi:MAG: DUF3168 domain-containing protein [Dehalococcoidia bacterium]|nr:DUF3168 domain-containing protein [Dehalococcoidia bacterium]
MIDTNQVIRTYLLTDPILAGLVGTKIYCPRVPEKTVLPAISFFTRGGTSLPIKNGIARPSVQFMCWDDNPIGAREVYGALFDFLQGTGGYYDAYTSVVIGANTYYILSATEEVQGQDLQDEASNYYYVLTFFEVKIKL